MPQLAANKKGLHNYHILETFEAGLELSGAEVKAVRGGHLSLNGSYITIDPTGQAWLGESHIPAYKQAAGSQKEYLPNRRRRLLLHRTEIDRLRGKSQENGLTIIPISAYTKGGLIKLEIGVARGKKQHDKREIVRKREVDRSIRAELKHR